MKKLILSVLLLSVLSCFCSCASQGGYKAGDYRVFDVNTPCWGDGYNLNHNYLYTGETEFMNRLAEQAKTLEIDGISVKMEYLHSEIDPDIGTRSDVYIVDDEFVDESSKKDLLSEQPTIRFDADTQSLHSINYRFGRIDITPEMSSDEVRVAVERYLKDALDVDLSGYEKVETDSFGTDDPAITTGYRTFCWYRQVKGHRIGDYTRVTVQKDGGVSGLWIMPPVALNGDNVPGKLFERGNSVEKTILSRRANALYNTDQTSFVDLDDSRFDTYIFERNGKLYIEYSVDIDFRVNKTGDVLGDVCAFLVEVPE